MLGNQRQRANQSFLLGKQLSCHHGYYHFRIPVLFLSSSAAVSFPLRCYLCPSCRGRDRASECQGAVSTSMVTWLMAQGSSPRPSSGRMMTENGHFFILCLVFTDRICHRTDKSSQGAELEGAGISVIPHTLGTVMFTSSASSKGTW